jgi:hypothetical protein
VVPELLTLAAVIANYLLPVKGEGWAPCGTHPCLV